ncbi:hypothetical protein Goshw_019984 [Gossypium schwendimanii]|uniref:Uncharacterized protein n=1 Tax=Gossypium schwendimanii TaxID=34291 RepID=A0A7J9NDE5_GOSSC|nr:hypothetical protein [Gossypium schwendimanii]
MGSTSNGVSSTQKVGKSLSLPHTAIACAAPLASCGMNWNSKFWTILHIAIISFITPSKIDLSFPWPCSFLMMVLESLSMLTSLKSHFFSKNGSLEACIHFSSYQISNVVDRCHLLEDLFYEDVVLEDVAYKLIFFSTKWA